MVGGVTDASPERRKIHREAVFLIRWQSHVSVARSSHQMTVCQNPLLLTERRILRDRRMPRRNGRRMSRRTVTLSTWITMSSPGQMPAVLRFR